MRAVLFGLLAVAAAAVAWMVWGGDDTPREDDVLVADTAPETDAAGPTLQGTEADVPAPATDRRGDLPIHVTVLDEKQAPVGGVRVRLERRTDMAPGTGYRALLENTAVSIRANVQAHLAGRSRAQETYAEGTADDQGRITFHVEAGMYYAYAMPTAPQVGTYGLAYVGLPDSPLAKVKLRVRDGTPLQGRVEDMQGAPLAAEIEASMRGFSVRTQSADDGTFSIAAVPEGTLRFNVTLPTGMHVRGLAGEAQPDGVVVVRVLAGTASVRGTVTSTDGTPLANAAVSIYVRIPPPADEPRRRRSFTVSAKTGEDGTFAWSGLPAGKLARLDAVADGYLALRATPGRGIEVTELRDGATETLDVELRQGARVHGMVTRKDNGKPIADATVTLFFLGYHPPRKEAQQTDARGRYAFKGVGDGKFMLLASHPTHYDPLIEAALAAPWGDSNNKPPASIVLQLPKRDEPFERNLVLLPGRAISGRVVDPDGTPAADASVFAKNTGFTSVAGRWGMHMLSSDSFRTPHATSAADGTFAIQGLAPRANWVLYPRKVGYAGTLSAPVSLMEADAKDVTLRLEKQCIVRGRVLTEDGEPVPDNGVHVSGYTELRGGAWRFRTDEDGKFEVHSLPASKQITISSHLNGEQADVKFTDLKPGDVREDVILQFGTKGKIQGTLTNSKGEAVVGVRLAVTRLDGKPEYRYGYPKGDGSFEIKNVTPGRVELRIHEGGRWVTLGEPITVPAAPVRLTYDKLPTATIQGRILDPDGKPVPLCHVSVRAEGGSSKDQEVTGGGFAITVSGTSPYGVYVSKPRAADGTVLSLRPKWQRVSDPSVPVTITLEAGHGVAGTVVDEKGAPVSGTRVSADGGSAHSDENGRFELLGLQEGRIGLEIKPPFGFIKPRPMVVDSGRQDLEIVLLKGTHVRGTIETPEGVGRVSATITARWEAQGEHPSGTASGNGNDGTFHVLGIPPGVVVSLDVRPRQLNDAKLHVAPATVEGIKSGATDVVVRLVLGVSISGTVVKSDGTPHTSGGVSARQGTRANSHGRLDEHGRFEVRGLKPGTYELMVFDGPRALPGSQEVTAPATDVRLVLPDVGTISGRLVDELPPDTRWTVRAVAEKEVSRQVALGADGTFTLEGLDKTRKWRVLVTRDDGKDDRYARSEPLAVGAENVALKFKEGARIDGRTDFEGKPLAQCWVRASAPGWRSYASTDVDGNFTLRGLPPGTYTLSAGNYGLNADGTREAVAAGATGVLINLSRTK